MENKAFKIIEQKLSEALLKNGFNLERKENGIVFSNGEIFYTVSFDLSKKRFDLFLSSEDEDNKKSLSAWLFDPNTDNEQQANDIANDFAQCVTGEKRVKIVRTQKKKSDDENNVNPLFLMNRIANLFPELKEHVKEEKDGYESFRGVTFAKEKALPIIDPVLNGKANQDKLKKLCTIFNNCYLSGDLDTRGIITIIFLNSIDNESAREKVEKELNNELKKASIEAKKLKGKKIKPEKIRKKKTFISDTLNSVNRN